MSICQAKVRIGPAGLHYFNRRSGLNVLIDEARPPEASWHAAPRNISIALTNSCDLACPYCYAPKAHAVLNYNSVCAWLREFDDHGALGVGFGGGEPTLHPRFADLCKYTADETDLSVTFTTHGHHLKNELLGQLRGKVNFIRLSMDGINKTYERLRGRSFALFTARLRELRASIPFGLNFVVNVDTIGELDAAIEYAEVEGAREFLLLPEQPIGSRSGIGGAQVTQLQAWVRAYRGNVRLAVSESGTEGIAVCNPCISEKGLRAYAHITATGRIQSSSFTTGGVPISPAGAIAALRDLQRIQPLSL